MFIHNRSHLKMKASRMCLLSRPALLSSIHLLMVTNPREHRLVLTRSVIQRQLIPASHAHFVRSKPDLFDLAVLREEIHF